MSTISTGSKCIDGNIGGGISPESIVLIYGEPETGKTTLAMQCAVNCALQNQKVLFVDCENAFSSKRLSQVASDKFDQIASQIILVKPKDFREQTALIDRIQDYTEKNFGLIIIDTLTGLYGAEVADYPKKKSFSVNRELNRQLALLAQTSKIRKIPVIVCSQVRAVLDNPNISVAPVANRVLTFWADTIISLKPTEQPSIVKVVVEKSRESSQEVNCYVQIVESGIQDTEFPE
jgi:RecA/RadA recombinase